MRVLFFTPRYPPDVGGVEHHVAHLATGLLARGHEPEVLTPVGPETHPGTERVDGVLVRRFAVPVPAQHLTVAPGVLRAAFAARGRGFDVVHAHSYHALPALFAALAHPAPLVFTPHYHGTGHGPLRAALHVPYRLAGRRVFGMARAVICVSAVEAALVGRDFPAVAPRVEVIPNGVDRGALPPPDPGAHTALVVARLEPYKRVDRVLDAAARLPEPWRVVVVGDGPARPALVAQAARLGLDARVRILGRVDDATLHAERARASVLVTLSEQEAFGLGVADAIAAGVPVVASDIPAHRELLEAAGAPAALQPAGADADALARAIVAARAAPHRDAVAAWPEVVERTLATYGRAASLR